MAALKKFYEGQSLADMEGLLRSHYLTEKGWLVSADRMESCDKEGTPIPWLTYPAIAMLERIAKPDWRVFEFGGGGSTSWWASRVASVVTAEHDPAWATHLQSSAPGNVEIVSRAQDNYASAIDERGLFDLVCIDGVERLACAKAAVSHVKPDGVIVFDNAELAEWYGDALAFLEDAGFTRIDFFGLGPINVYEWNTAFFVRSLTALR